MSVYAGIDLGTSGIKAVLADERDSILASASRKIRVDSPQPGWSQQDPDLWWHATEEIFGELAMRHPDLMQRLASLSLSGQMLGAVLLDKADRPTHPCLLWNDQRSIPECRTLLERVPDIGWRTNGHPDPGLTAPKLLWLAKHEPRAIDDADILMLPKDYVRLCLTGERFTEPSDGAGTMLMDCVRREWDGELVEAAGWSMDRLPRVIPSHAPAGRLREELRRRWGVVGQVTVAAGAGDNFGCALGVGAATPGDAVVTIGTSGVLCAVDGEFHPAPQHAVLTSPHAAPDTYLSMGVVMSATQSLDWLAGLTGTHVTELVHAVDERVQRTGIAHMPIIRPSLTGVRTPHNRPDAGASFSGVSAISDKVDLAYAVMEGVAFQFLESYKAQSKAGVPIETIRAVGGGSRNAMWVGLIATLLQQEIRVPKSSDASACIGAVRLGRAALDPDAIKDILNRKSENTDVISPLISLDSQLQERFERFIQMPI
jgi:xylulokinase